MKSSTAYILIGLIWGSFFSAYFITQLMAEPVVPPPKMDLLSEYHLRKIESESASQAKRLALSDTRYTYDEHTQHGIWWSSARALFSWGEHNGIEHEVQWRQYDPEYGIVVDMVRTDSIEEDIKRLKEKARGYEFASHITYRVFDFYEDELKIFIERAYTETVMMSYIHDIGFKYRTDDNPVRMDLYVWPDPGFESAEQVYASLEESYANFVDDYPNVTAPLEQAINVIHVPPTPTPLPEIFDNQNKEVFLAFVPDDFYRFPVHRMQRGPDEAGELVIHNDCLLLKTASGEYKLLIWEKLMVLQNDGTIVDTENIIQYRVGEWHEDPSHPNSYGYEFSQSYLDELLEKCGVENFSITD